MSAPPRFPLSCLPTPIIPMPRLTAALGGPRLYVKRDDLTGLAGGGNKSRKLEFLVADALARGADTLVTAGAVQSNHCRQTAAAAARAGLRSVLVLGGVEPAGRGGNLLLDLLLGAELRWTEGRDRGEVMAETVAAEQAAGRRPYPIPVGGSNGLGSVGYALAMEEMAEQLRSDPALGGVAFDRIVLASSSGGTHAGLAAGARAVGFRGQVLGISIDEEAGALRSRVAKLATEAAACLDRPHRFQPDDVAVDDGYLGEGYGRLGAAERAAIDLFARTEAILLDPVYTGRAAAGMLDLIRRGVIGRGETVLFWHTGGTPALWAYEGELTAGHAGAGRERGRLR